ncbi:glycosyltransferase family 2 protein [Clostridium saudiense]|uniref:glycosyltransferase family 2 protein n=1 Tax=Clostridium saudiense TaxID=1414720 RepID=UPI0018AA99AD|nr:glycosyltransferase family 2 protein [Clostridium saudiense]
MNICCVVVTYNRKKLLLECINALQNQTYKLSKIIIIDNNSNDGTEKYLYENGVFESDIIDYQYQSKNLGGAGGFYQGIRKSLQEHYDWVWIMDDDTIPTENALENFIIALDVLKEEKVSFLCSKVIGINNEEMNLPSISKRLDENSYPIWMKYLNKSIIEVEDATFVSLLVRTDAIKKVGLPWKEFFIWGDDTEYTMRLTTMYGTAYVVGNSVVIHKRLGPSNLSILEEENEKRILMYRYQFRNGLINAKEYFGNKIVFRIIGGNIKTIFKIFLKSKNKILKSRVIVGGTCDYLFKRYDYKSFKNRGEYNEDLNRKKIED